MKKLLLVLVQLLSGLALYASHIYGGEMTYTATAGAPAGFTKYRITLKLFRDNDGGGAELPTLVYIGVFDYASQQHYPNTQSYYQVPRDVSPTPVNMNVDPCATGNTNANYSVATYTLTIDLPNNTAGYIAAYETCCRVNNLANVFHPGGTGGTGSTYACRITGVNNLPAGQTNSSPQFITALDLVCNNAPFSWNFSAVDPDGDSLVYAFAPAYNRTTATSAANVAPAAPMLGPLAYPPLIYINGFTSDEPLGTRASINSATGLISGIAPDMGQYVVCVMVQEYRNSTLIGEHRKDFILRVQDCDLANADLDPEYVNCGDSFSWTFHNNNHSAAINTYLWNFGDGNTSTEVSPTHTYADTGTYIVKLYVNKGEECEDSSSTIMKVYPGFRPGFVFSGICVNKPTQFTDTSRTRYGVVNGWRWDFGDASTTLDQSTLQHPTWTYNSMGDKNVRLIVTSDKGCRDTVLKAVPIIDRPPLTVAFADTLICRGDQVQLEAIGNGNFSWAPATNITNPQTATPTVNPPVTTSYTVTLDDNGCLNTASVRVRVVNLVTLSAMPDTTICSTDTLRLRAMGDGLRYSWTPAATLNNANLQNPLARPLANTTYQVTATIGSCTATEDVVVTLVPYPNSRAGNDVEICYNASTQLRGSIVGNRFTWTPASSLDNPASLTPVASPRNTTAYVLTVFDDLGCPKPGRDTVLVTVLPEVHAFAGNDTAVVIGQPLQFQGSGGVRYLWSPATALSNPRIANPVGNYDGSFEYITYKLDVADALGCTDTDSITVRIFKTGPRIFVPTAFTPNLDGRNDRFRFVAVGIEKIEYFRVYNRWGQVVYSSTSQMPGWDGRFNGKDQGSGVYVWMVQGVDYTGKKVFEKGTMALIR